MKKRIPVLSLVVGLCLLTKSCYKDGDLNFKNLRVSENFIYDLPLPLIDSRLSLERLLKNKDTENQYVLADPETGFLRLVYNVTDSFNLSDLGFAIPRQSTTQYFIDLEVPAGIEIPGIPDPWQGDSIRFPEESFSINFDIKEDIRIDFLKTEEMNFEYHISTGIRNKARFVITSTNIEDENGRPFMFSETLEVGLLSMEPKFLPLFGHSVVPDNSDPDNPQLHFSYTITVFKDENETVPYWASNNRLTMSFEDISIDYAYGYFGQQNFSIPSSGIDIPIFERFPIERLEIDTAYMNLKITNSLGIPVRMNARIATLTRNRNGQSGEIKVWETEEEGLDLNYPQDPLAPPVDTTFRERIEHLIDINSGFLPYRVDYSANVTTNPEGETAPNFVKKGSFIKADIGAEIPMRLKLAGLELVDTIPFQGLPFTDGIEEVIIRANLHNGFPLDAAVYLYFLNQRGHIIDSVWAYRMPHGTEKRPLEILGGEVDEMSGRVVNPTVSQLSIPLTKPQIDNLMRARYFKIKGVLNTSEEGNVWVNVYEGDTEGFLRVMIGCRIKVNGKFLDDFLGND
jgi:hypothetical protein